MNSTKTAATYYVRIDTYWQNSPDRFVGPFASRSEAEAAIAAARDAEGSLVQMSENSARDVRYGIRVYEVLSASEAKRSGAMIGRYDDNGDNNILSEIPLTTDALHTLEDC